MSDHSGQARGTGGLHVAEGRFGRRAVLLGAAATGAGVAASLAGSGVADAAGKSGPVLLGKSNSAGATTEVTTRSGSGLVGQTHATGQSGVVGIDVSTAAGGRGVYGHSIHGAGVMGISKNSSGVSGLASTVGESGVAGVDQTPTTGGHGVFGQSEHGNGVYATSLRGIGLRAQSANGLALLVQGRTRFDLSGLATVKAGHDAVTVSVPGLKPSNIVLATIQQPQHGIFIIGALPAHGSFTITLSGSVESDTKVGWMVLESFQSASAD